MAKPSKPDCAQKDSILLAHISCLFLGVGMIFWGMAPELVQRLVTGHAPTLDTLLFNSATFSLGMAFIGMHVLLRRGVLWAAWAAFLASAVLAAGGLALITVIGIQFVSLFLLLLSGCTCFSSWLAIATLTHHSRQPMSETTPVRRNPKRSLFK